MINIKCCPFCGGKARLKKLNRTIIGGELKRNTYIYCPVCDVRGKRILYDDYSEKVEAENVACESWNVRC